MSQVKPEPAPIQQLCAEIAAEENPSKVNHLVESLRNSVDIEHAETRLRLRLIAQQYRERIQSAPLKTATTMRDVLSFLGLIRSHGDGKAGEQPETLSDEALNEGDGEKSEAA
jgi:hypothetical protein